MADRAAHDLARPTAQGLAVRAVGLPLGLLVAVFLARNLAAEDLGAYQGVLSICIILGGLASATAERPATRRIAALDHEDPNALRNEVAIAHLLVGIAMFAIVVALLGASFVPLIPEDARVTLRLSALVAPGVAFLSLRQWIALPLRGVAASLGPEQIGLPIAFLGLAGLASSRSGLEPVEALAIYAVVSWGTWLLSSWRSGLLLLLRGGLQHPPTPSTLRGRVREGRPFVVLTAVGELAIYAIVPLVAMFSSLADAGRLAVALQMSVLVAVPLQIVSLAIMPRCARLHREHEDRAINALVRRASTISLGLGLALALVLLLSLETVLELLGPTFAAASALVPVLIVGQLINAALGPNGPTMQMIGLERAVVRVEAVTTVLRFAVVALAASTGNMTGVAFAIAATTTLRNVLLSTMLYRRAGILTLPQVPRRHGR